MDGKTLIYKRPTPKAWRIIHILVPLFPFLLEGLIKFITNKLSFSLDIFSFHTLAASVGLLSIFVSQSLLASKGIIEGVNTIEELMAAAWKFNCSGFVAFSLFAILVVLQYLSIPIPLLEANRTLDDIIRYFKLIVVLHAFYAIIIALRAQKSFKLRTMF